MVMKPQRKVLAAKDPNPKRTNDAPDTGGPRKSRRLLKQAGKEGGDDNDDKEVLKKPEIDDNDDEVVEKPEIDDNDDEVVEKPEIDDNDDEVVEKPETEQEPGKPVEDPTTLEEEEPATTSRLSSYVCQGYYNTEKKYPPNIAARNIFNKTHFKSAKYVEYQGKHIVELKSENNRTVMVDAKYLEDRLHPAIASFYYKEIGKTFVLPTTTKQGLNDCYDKDNFVKMKLIRSKDPSRSDPICRMSAGPGWMIYVHEWWVRQRYAGDAGGFGAALTASLDGEEAHVTVGKKTPTLPSAVPVAANTTGYEIKTLQEPGTFNCAGIGVKAAFDAAATKREATGDGAAYRLFGEDFLKENERLLRGEIRITKQVMKDGKPTTKELQYNSALREVMSELATKHGFVALRNGGKTGLLEFDPVEYNTLKNSSKERQLERNFPDDIEFLSHSYPTVGIPTTRRTDGELYKMNHIFGYFEGELLDGVDQTHSVECTQEKMNKACRNEYVKNGQWWVFMPWKEYKRSVLRQE